MDLPVRPPTRLSWPLWLKLIIALIIVLYLTLAVGVTVFSWSGSKVRTISRWVPVPVAFVAGRPVWSSTVFDQASALDTYNAYQQSAQLPTQSSANTLASGLTKSIKDLADMALLKTHKLTVSQNDIDQAYTTEVNQAGAASTIEKTLQDLYGWTPAQFKKYVVKIDILRDRLREKFSFDTALNTSAQEQANTVKQQIAADGKNMADIAGRYSQDAYAANGGLTDFIKKGELVQEIDQAAFSLEPGAISDVIHTKFGFHIIQVVERRGEGDAAEVKLRSIFIAAPSVEDAEKKYLSEHRPNIWIRSLRWDPNTSLVTER